jgi:hypothetical protein
MLFFDKMIKNEDKKAKIKLPSITHSLEHVLARAGDKMVQGIDSNRLALVSIRKKENFYLLGIQYERRVGTEIFTERHDSAFESKEDAIKFFSKFGLGEISWLGT